MSRFDVVIAGAGVTGLGLAALLRADGWQVALIDPQPMRPWRPDVLCEQRVIALTLASARLLQRLGVWQHLRQDRIAGFEGMQVWDGVGTGAIRFDAADHCQACLGYVIETRNVTAALESLLSEQPDGLTQYRGEQLSGFSCAGQEIRVQLESGQGLQAGLLIGADGVASRVRQLAAIGSKGRDYQQQALVAAVKTELAHQRTARQCFLPSGPLAFLPLYQDHWCSIVWSTTPQQAGDLLELSARDFETELSTAFQHRLGAVVASGPRAAFTLQRSHAQSYIGARIALVGDAAHRIHPLAGQGANLGLMDCAVLAQCLRDARSRGGKDPGSQQLLKRYQRWRRGENLAMLLAMDGFRDLFGSGHPSLRWLRSAGLNLMDRAVPVKSLLARRAMGLDGDLPELLR